MKRSFIFLLALLVLLPASAFATVTFSVVANLGKTTNGYTPFGLVQAGDGNFYGTTEQGGTSADGTIYQLTPTGMLTTIHSFTGGADGALPQGPLTLGSDGNLYGTTGLGGGNGNGVFYQITLAGTLTVLHSFNITTESEPPSQLYLGTDGNFYGPSTAVVAGKVVARFIKITPTGTLTVVHTFNAATEGNFLNPEIVLAGDGNFYGTTLGGGSKTDGTIFKITPAGTVTVLATLADPEDQPVLTTLGADGKIYGYSVDSIFSLTTSGARTPFYTFTDGTDGGDPSTLIQGGDGNFYGTSVGFGTNAVGTFFKITSGGTFSKLHDFTLAERFATTLIEGTDGNYYATSPSTGAAQAGAVLQLTTGGASTTLLSFVAPGYQSTAALCQASDGNLYGVTKLGGASGIGTAFGITTTGTLVSYTDFDNDNTGGTPTTPFIQDPTTHTMYVSTTTGGPNFTPVLNLGGSFLSAPLPSATPGIVSAIKLKAADPVFTDGFQPYSFTLLDFTDASYFWAEAFTYSLQHPSAVRPFIAKKAIASPAIASPGSLYASAMFGGDFNQGIVINFASDGSFIAGCSFGDPSITSDGRQPAAAPVHDSAGNFYGTTTAGGAGNFGAIYKITPADATTGTHTIIHSFATATGSVPANNCLVIDSKDTIYGTTQSGGAAGGGVVYSITAAGVYKVLHSFAAPKAGADGSVPRAGLLLATDGNLYGTTQSGGVDGFGTVFSITPAGKLTILHSFVATDGATPQAALIQGVDGKLYGITSGGGSSLAASPGVVFSIDAGLPIPPGTTPQTISFAGIPNQVTGAVIGLTATASSNLAVSFAVTGPATLSGSTLTVTGIGTVKVTASQPGNPTFAAAIPVSQTFSVTKASQSITFPNIADQTFGEAAFTLPSPPTSSSNLAVTIKVLSGPAKILGTKVTVTGVGAVTLAANQAGNANYNPAAQVTASFNVVKASQTIAAFATIPTHNKGDLPFTIVIPKASSALPVTVTVQSGPASIVGAKITVTGVGTVTLAANQAGSVNFNAAPEVTTTFAVDPTNQTIKPFAVIAAKLVGAAPFAVITPTATSGLPVAVTVFSGPATLAGNTVTVTGAGTVILAANQGGDANFLPAPQVTTSFVVNGQPQTIAAFAKIPAHTFGDAPFAITPPTATSGLPVTVIVKFGPATISSNTITITGAGTVTLAADQAGNTTFNPAKEVLATFVVNKATQTIGAIAPGIPSPPNPSTVSSGASFALEPPTSSSGLPVTLTVKSGPAKYDDNLLLIIGAGTVTLQATAPANANFLAATVTKVFIVNKATQTIAAFSAIADHPFGGAPFTITPPVASSGLVVTVKVLSGPATILANKVTIKGTGLVTLAANQAGNANVSAATQVTTSFNATPGTQTILPFAVIPAKIFGALPFAVVSPKASSGLVVTLSVVSGPATIAANKVTLTGTGTVVLAADQGGSANYNAAAEVTTSFTVNKANQTIHAFAAIAAHKSTSAPFTIPTPTATSGLPVTVTVFSGPATISGNTITLTSGVTGTVVLHADQSGNANFNAAPTVTASFIVN